MDPILLCIAVGFGALAGILAVRLILVKSDVRQAARTFAQRIEEDSNARLGTGSGDGSVRLLTDELNDALLIYSEKRHLFESQDRRMREKITNLAHDLRTPLTAIVGYLDILEANAQRASEIVPILKGRAELMTEVMEQLFEFSLAESGRPLEKSKDIDLRSVLEESVLGLYPQFMESGAVPSLSLPEDPVMRRIDRRAAERLFGNILTNAIRHGEGEVEIDLSKDGCVRVRNAAPGMTKLDVGKIFDRFFTVRGAGKSTGLGLGIALSLAKELGGQMTADLLDGSILEVEVRLPQTSEKGRKQSER